MKPADTVRFAFRALTDRKLRAVLTIIAITIGPATIVSLVAATQGYSNATTSQFSSLGATSVFVTPVGRSFTLTDSVLAEIQGLAGVSAVVPYQQMSGTVTQGGESVSYQILATNLTALKEFFPTLSLGSGSLPSPSDLTGAAVGYSVANPGISGAENLTVNDVVGVSGIRSGSFIGGGGAGFAGFARSGSSSQSSGGSAWTFVVTGVFGSYGQGLVINPDTTIFIPLQEGEQIIHSAAYTGAVVVASSPSDVQQVDSELSTAFGQEIRATSVTSLVSTIQSVSSGATSLLEIVAGTSVIVAFIGILTTMLTTVLERTNEIGVMKALGSTSRGILAVFLTEAVITGFLGGVLGAVSGSVLSYFVIGALNGNGLAGLARIGVASRAGSTALAISPAISPALILLALGIATAVGTLGGLIPAWRASRLTPVEALHRS
ncbi:MAG: ABC transporter permease [Nitrososphaerota archaeon]|nr:ABC transporter permease [Nitrososphaerota archaeon]